MRSKSKTSTDLSIDYSKCKFECQVTKKKFLGFSRRFLYVFDREIVINKEQKKRKPDRILMIDQTKRVIWKYNEKGKRTLKGFTLDYFNKSLEYYGDEHTLGDLKKYLAKILFQARVQDEYEAQCVVGQGNYALVLELKHLHSDLKLASKCIDKKKLERVENGMESVLNEINIMRALSPHSQIINLYEVYEGDNNIYLIMDLAEGGSLYNEMKNRKYLFSRKEIQLIMKSLLEALSYMHSKGIMHRDLKPENVLYQVKGDYSSLKLADFGLSTFASHYPYLYPKCGTPGFVAPEVGNLIDKQEGYDVRCDVFSAGVIFHILLFGESLFVGKGHADILKLNKKCEINYKHKRYEMIDPDAKDLLFKMLEIDPNVRITSSQCLDHAFFHNSEYPQNYPTLLRENSSGNGEVKPITPGTQSPFHNYFQKNNEEALKSPNQTNKSPQTKSPTQLPNPPRLKEKQTSIITRTPIYKEIVPINAPDISDFSLDKDSQSTKNNRDDQDVDNIIVEEQKEQNFEESPEGRRRLSSLNVNLSRQKQY